MSIFRELTVHCVYTGGALLRNTLEKILHLQCLSCMSILTLPTYAKRLILIMI